MALAVDTDFINPIDTRPKLSKIEDHIPIIDLSSIKSLDHLPNTNAAITDPKIHALLAEIRSACEKWGFFQVVNHGVPLEKVTNLERVAFKFFGQNKEEKTKVKRCRTNPMGYSDDEHTGIVKDWKEGFDFAVCDSALTLDLHDDPNPIQLRNQWPVYPHELREVAEEYAVNVKKMGFKLLEVIALSLELTSNRLTDFYKDPALFMRLNHYMACPNPDLVLGIGAHKDSGGMTLLSEDDVGGLEVRRIADGEWISVKPTPGAFIVNIADAIQVWSNDKYKSVEHRVTLNSEKARLSVAFNFGPAYNVDMEPLEELVDEQNPAKYTKINFGEYRASVMKGNVIKPNKALEISQFRINV